MIASLCFSIILRLIDINTALFASFFLYAFWILTIFILWHYYFKPHFINSDFRNKPLKFLKEPKEEENLGLDIDWNSKLVNKEDFDDKRLPITVVTGYL